MLRKPWWLAVVLFILTVSACGGEASQSEAIPRPHSYPRLNVYPAHYTSPGSLPCGFRINNYTDLSCTSNHSSLWANISYPLYNATLRCTFTPATQAQQAEIIDNRLQRMGMNLGDNAAEQTTVASADSSFTSTLLRSSGPTITPLQFLSTSPHWVVSGALEMPSAAVNIDSVRPLIDAVYADILHSLTHLSDK